LVRVLTRARLPLYARLVVIGFVQALGSIGAALLIRSAHHGIAGPTTAGLGHIVVLAFGLIAAVALAAGTRAAERVGAERLGQHYVTEVRADLFEHLTKVPARHLGRRNRGNMLLRFVGDLSALRSWVSLGLAKVLVAGITVTLAVAFLVYLDPAIGLAVTAVLVVGAVSTVITNPRLMASSRTARSRRARLMGEVTERLTHIGVLQAAGQQLREHRRVGRLSARVSDAMIDRARAAGMCRAVAEATSGLAVVAVVVVGAVQAQHGHSSPGTVLAAVTVVGMLTGHMRDLGRVAEYAAGARVARAAAYRFLALPTLPDPAGQPDLRTAGGALELDGVGLAGALDAVTLRAEPGQTVAIVGANGAGKSTLVALAARLLDPDQGAVRLDGQDLRSRSVASVRAAIGIAGPDLPLLRGSVERNVLYRRPRAGKREIARVTALCGLDDLAADLPGGWQAEVGDGGSLLSAGQRARVTIARAALGNPTLLILDEAEAHLDGSAADVVDRVLADHSGTALVVTHRRELMERADVIWFLHDGRVVEAGPPRVVLRRDGPVARLLADGTSPAPAAVARASAAASRPDGRVAVAGAAPGGANAPAPRTDASRPSHGRHRPRTYGIV
jgi:ABC-type multidrug transport system fused ATPase/permease subunit